jgi:hypothetical protein
LPQTAQAGGLSGSLGGLASLAGINLSAGTGGGGEIPPSMYATVLASEPFRKRILDAKIWRRTGEEREGALRKGKGGRSGPGLSGHSV